MVTKHFGEWATALCPCGWVTGLMAVVEATRWLHAHWTVCPTATYAPCKH
jgi:hypothetical protein